MRARFLARNHRGVAIPRTLGIWLAVAAIVSTALVAVVQPDGPVGGPGFGALAATLLVFAAGLVDDLVEGGPRGIRDHLRALADGRVSSGIVKLVVIPAAGVVAIALQAGGSMMVRLAGVVLIAACANAWNGLDVRPGRALKFALLAMVGLVGVPLRLLPTLPLVALGAVAALWPDLRERAMLGDGGSNLLGFTIGLGLYLVLPGWGVVVGAVLAVGLNVVAETTTFSRVIARVPPLRWFDGLGRLKNAET